MTIINWNEKVNRCFSLDGEYSQEEGFVQTIDFESGKKRDYLKNSYIPIVYPSLSLALDNTEIIGEGQANTEFKIFKYWYEVILRYGTFSFIMPKLGSPNEDAVYHFISKPEYDETDGIIIATFGLREEVISESAISSSQIVTLTDQPASDQLPNTGKVGNILQTVRNFLKWTKEEFARVKEWVRELLSGRNEWLPPVNTFNQLWTTHPNGDPLDTTVNYLCKVVEGDSYNTAGVYQRVAETNQWVVYDRTVNLVNEQELSTAIAYHNTNTDAHSAKFAEKQEAINASTIPDPLVLLAPAVKGGQPNTRPILEAGLPTIIPGVNTNATYLTTAKAVVDIVDDAIQNVDITNKQDSIAAAPTEKVLTTPTETGGQPRTRNIKTSIGTASDDEDNIPTVGAIRNRIASIPLTAATIALVKNWTWNDILKSITNPLGQGMLDVNSVFVNLTSAAYTVATSGTTSVSIAAGDVYKISGKTANPGGGVEAITLERLGTVLDVFSEHLHDPQAHQLDVTSSITPTDVLPSGIMSLGDFANSVKRNLLRIGYETDAHNNSDTVHADIRQEVAAAKSIAEGRSQAKVFATKADMNTWLAGSTDGVPNIDTLNIGDNLYIVDTDEPDYWWDGEQPQKLEAEKIDLTAYFTKTEINNLLSGKVDTLTLAAELSRTSAATVVLSPTGTNDHTLINNAIANLPSGGGKIILREGTYAIGGAINVNKNNVTIEGMGDSTVLNGIVGIAYIIYITASYCKIANLKITNNDTVNEIYGIFIASNNNVITGNTCSNSSNISNSYGIYLHGGSNNVITGNTCTNSGSSNSYGIYLNNSSNNNVITGNTCSNSSSNNSFGIFLNNSNNNVITGNTCSNRGSNNSFGIYNNGNNVITGNYCPDGSGGTLELGETSTTAYRGDKGNTAYEHSQGTHAPSNAQKNSDITKAEIEAKLTGAITSHSHAQSSHTHADANTGGQISYNDLTNRPTIPAAQIQSDWNQSSTTALDFIKNKPSIPSAVLAVTVPSGVAASTAAKYVNSVTGGEPAAGTLVLVTFTNGNTATTPTLNIRSGTSGGTARNIRFNGANINGSSGNPGNYAANARVLFYFNDAQQYEQIAVYNAEPSFTKNTAFNKNFGNAAGTVCEGNDSRLSNARTPTSHTHADANTGGQISYNDLTNKPTIPAAQIQSDWNQSSTTALDFIKNKPTIPAALNRTVVGDDNATTAITDTGGNLSIPTPFTMGTRPTASSTEHTSTGAVTLRSVLRTLIANVRHLFANKMNNDRTISINGNTQNINNNPSFNISSGGSTLYSVKIQRTGSSTGITPTESYYINFVSPGGNTIANIISYMNTKEVTLPASGYFRRWTLNGGTYNGQVGRVVSVYTDGTSICCTILKDDLSMFDDSVIDLSNVSIEQM